MQNYPPGHVVLVVHLDGKETFETYLSRTYYEGKGDHRDLRCERWGSEEANARAAELGIRCVRAFVPYPVPEPPPAKAIWRAINKLFQELRELIVNNPFGLSPLS